MDEMGRLREGSTIRRGLDARLEQAMDALLPGPDADVELSGGERRRVACKLLLEQPDLLLLDEPTTTRRGERAVVGAAPGQVPGTVIAIPIYFLDNVAQWILEIDRGRAYPSRAASRPT
jgi:ATPase subunit of ABC transporter with duplicated ATPase domains